MTEKNEYLSEQYKDLFQKYEWSLTSNKKHLTTDGEILIYYPRKKYLISDEETFSGVNDRKRRRDETLVRGRLIDCNRK